MQRPFKPFVLCLSGLSACGVCHVFSLGRRSRVARSTYRTHGSRALGEGLEFAISKRVFGTQGLIRPSVLGNRSYGIGNQRAASMNRRPTHHSSGQPSAAAEFKR